MENILTFLKILFFGSAIIITPSPVDIGLDDVELIFPEKIEAITGGASFYIDITSHISSDNVHDAFNEIDEKYPEGCVQAVLYDDNENKVFLDRSSGSWGSNSVALILYAQHGIPVNMEFTSMKISSCKEIKNIIIKWRNHKK